eukprot:555472-Rhodomonas_salina.3
MMTLHSLRKAVIGDTTWQYKRPETVKHTFITAKFSFLTGINTSIAIKKSAAIQNMLYYLVPLTGMAQSPCVPGIVLARACYGVTVPMTGAKVCAAPLTARVFLCACDAAQHFRAMCRGRPCPVLTQCIMIRA